EEPIRQIVENAGAEGSVIVEKVKHETVATRGFDADSMEFVDMLQAGIIDPTKVDRVALANAASMASLLLTTEALVTDIPEDKAGMCTHEKVTAGVVVRLAVGFAVAKSFRLF